MIDPATFSRDMERHWTQTLGNIANEPLKQTWHRIAKTLNEHIQNHGSPTASTRWSVLRPPTGSGKTQSVILYSAMLADLPHHDHPGILIVTRRIEDCEGIAKLINGLTENADYAVAYHSKSSLKLDELKAYPVVVITHKAYENALDYLGDSASIRQTWPYFHNWQIDTRKLVVIDECIDIVESNQAGLDGLRQTLAAIPETIREEHEGEINLIQEIINVLEQVSAMPGEKEDTLIIGKNHPYDEVYDISSVTDLSGLIAALKDVRFDLQNGKNDNLECKRLRQRHTKRLKDLQHILRSWSYFSMDKGEHTLHTARLLVPEETKGAVVFDATADQNVLYELFNDSVIIPTPGGTRDYSNVTLHVSRGHSVGKNYMKTHAKKLCGELISELNPVLGKNSNALVVCHKDVEPALVRYNTDFQMQTAHWGAIDGSNEWKDCDSVVIFGLPYKPDYWTANVYMALQEPTSTEWLRDSEHRQFGKHIDIRQALKYGQIATDVIQAINRVRCRKVVDAMGNCQETHVYILLPDNSLGTMLTDAIRNHMPGIQFKEWDYTGQKKKARASKHEASLVKFIENMEPGAKFSMAYLQKCLGISPATLRRLKAKAGDPDTDIGQVMSESGAVFKLEKYGQTHRSYLMKPSI